MINKKYFKLLIITVILGRTTTLYAQNANPINVVTTAVPFLRISTDARADGMGETNIATSPDANAVYWNPGKLAFNASKAALVANYTPWLRNLANDMYNTSLAGFHKLDESQAIHASLNYFNLGDMQFEDNNGNHLQAFHPREWSAAVGYSRKISDKSGLGLSMKFIYSNLANKSVDGDSYKPGRAGAVDLGYYYNGLHTNGDGWSFGAVLSNLGSKIDYNNDASQRNFIPANLGLGACFTKVIDEQNKISLALDVNKLLVPTSPASGDSVALIAYRNKSVVGSWFSSFSDAPGGFSEELKEFQVSLGAEYWYNNQFALRAGYFYESPQKGNRIYFTAGASVKYNIITVNFSYTVPGGNSINKSPLANTLRFGLQFDLTK